MAASILVPDIGHGPAAAMQDTITGHTTTKADAGHMQYALHSWADSHLRTGLSL